MKVIIGTHNGMMKVVNLDENVQMNLFGRYELNNAVETLCWGDPDSGEDLVGAGFSHGDVQFWNPITQKLIFDCGKRSGKVKGLYTFGRESGRMVVSCTHNSELNICPMELPKDYEHKPIRLEGNNDSAIWRMRPNPLSEQKLLYAGYHIMPTLFDIEKSKTVWRGKFEKPKFYGIKQRQFFTDFQFLPDSASVFATGSRYREFRIYDLRKGAAPVLDFDVTQTATWEFAMISLAVTHHTPTIIYATEATGKIAAFDMRTGRLHKVYRDGMGTVKSLAFHPTERVMGAVGLDRYMRVYDIDKRLQKLSDKISLQYRFRGDTMLGANMYNKMFLKQKLNTMMFFSEPRMKKKVAEDEIKEEGKDEEDTKEDVKDSSIILEGEGEEDVWEGLTKVGDLKNETDEDMDLLEIKEEPEDEDDTPKKPTKKSQSKTKVKEEDEEDEEEGDEDDEDDEEDDEDDEDDDEEYEDGEGEDAGEGEFKLGEFAEDNVEESEEEDSEEEPIKKGKKAPQHTKKQGSSAENKKQKRLIKEKEEKKKEKKRKKSNVAFAKKQRVMAKKRKILGK